MRFFSIKKQLKTNPIKESFERATGLPYEQAAIQPTSPLVTKILIHGFLVFAGVYGIILFYTSCFDITFNEPMVVLFLILISVYTAFLYYNNLIKNIGYLVLLFAFVWALFSLRVYANSGFSAIYNITFEAIDKIYDLPAVRQMSERIENRYETITICLCFLGGGGAILLNTVVSNSMNVWASLFFTFPVLAIGLYFDRVPSTAAVLLLSVFYVSLIVLGPNDNYTPSALLRRKGVKKRGIVYPSDGRVMGQMVLALFGALAILYLLLTLLVPRRTFQVPEKWQSYKKQTDDYVRTFVMVGLSGLFNRYDAKGGISGGQLGGVASIRPSFETDLVVRFAPYDLNTVYLKSFTGTNYQYNHWETNNQRRDDSEASPNHEGLTVNEAVYNAESSYFKELFEAGVESVIQGKMEIRNVNANTNYPYLPYYSYVTNTNDKQCLGGAMVKGTSPLNQTDVITYYQSFQQDLRIAKNNYPDLDYFQLPSDLLQTLLGFCKENGFGGSKEQVINQIIDFFAENYPYSVSPGATPRDKDFVSYFLLENKKGFCVHFASAATLLFRAMDIPARYVEGYAIPYSQIMDGELVEGESYGDWLKGNAPLGETAVMEVTVTDAYAHAWVEVWFSEYGWVPVEVTPGSLIDMEDAYSDFWSFFGNIFQNNGEETENTGANLPFLNEKSRQIIFHAMQYSIYAIIAFFLLFHGFIHMKRYRSYHTKNQNTNLSNRYRALCNISRIFSKEFADCQNQAKQIEWWYNLYWQQSGDMDKASFSEWEEALKKACYSPYDVTREEYEYSIQMMKRIQAYLFQTSRIPIKIRMLLWVD